MGEPLGRHTGYKATVVRVITQRPCFSFFVTLVMALFLGGVGFALGAMQIDTEGWETRGTEIADRAMTIKTWKYGKFTLSEGVPLAFGRDEDSRRRRLLSLDDEDVNNEVVNDLRLRFPTSRATADARCWTHTTPPSRALTRTSRLATITARTKRGRTPTSLDAW